MPRRNYRKGKRKRAAFLQRQAERELRELSREVHAEQAARRDAEEDVLEPADPAAHE